MNIIEWITKTLESPVGSGVFVLLFFGGIVFCVWKLSHWNTKIDFIDDIKGNMDSIRESVGYLKGEFKSLSERQDKLFNAHSPIQINELGEKIANEVNAQDIIINHWQKIKEMLEEQNFNNSYDIQEFCLDLVIKKQEMFTTEEMKSMKEAAFNHGLGIFSVYRLVGLVARDKYFEVKNIDISDVDKHDPEKNN